MRATLLQALAGAVLAVGLYFTGRTYYLNRQGQITDRFTKAIDQLGHDRLDVRLGGIYALERIARESQVDHWPVMEVLTAFIRERVPVGPQDALPARGDRLATDIQAVLTVLGRRRREHEDADKRLDLRAVDLRNADLTKFHLERANLERANLENARAAGVYLEGANLDFVNLSAADLGGALLSGGSLRVVSAPAAILISARLEECFLEHATLDGARLMNADLSSSSLRGTSFRHANLTAANFDRTLVGGANFEAATLEHARNLTREQFQSAVTDQSTTLPVFDDE